MSKYRREESSPLPKHRHCNTCGTPIEMTKDYCSDKCRVEHGRATRRRTRNIVIITAAVLIFYLFVLFGRI